MSNAEIVIVLAVGLLALLAVAWCVGTGRRLDEMETKEDALNTASFEARRLEEALNAVYRSMEIDRRIYDEALGLKRPITGLMPALDLPDVTRVCVVTEKERRVLDHRDAYPNGCEVHIQDEGRTIKILPRQETTND
ncbi:hypothetical protein [Corynebacterium provencense]|uniref:hypothetical protein n=1 Tax=Corynebacterium provencense TaxID=1737425 RepID=UPI0008364BA4|nr:hypothetical protein [Corynebacterium provencense]